MIEMVRDTLEKPDNTKERQKVVTFQFNVPTIDLKHMEVQSQALALIPASLALEYKVLPITLENGILTVATESPDDLQLINTLAVLTKKKIKAATGSCSYYALSCAIINWALSWPSDKWLLDRHE